MKTDQLKSIIYHCLTLILATLPSFGARAATFSIQPAAIGNEFNGVVTLQIDGLNNGETVRIAKYADLNGNGIIDTGDMLMEDFPVTDGFVTIIGGATNLNVPYDSTGTNGAITTPLNFLSNDSIRHFVGNYLFRLASPGGGFTPVTNSFSVTNSPHLQRITGVVRNGATSVAGATVVLLTLPPDQNIVAGTTADSGGNYSIEVAAGTYLMLGLRTGYVGDFFGSPIAVLHPNQTIVTNINLIAATEVIDGRVVSAANANVGLPGVVMFAQSSSNSYTLGSTRTDGTFTLPVTPDVWQFEPQSENLATRGYLSLQDWPPFDATSGSVSNAVIPAPPGTALFYGTVRNETGAAVAGVLFRANDSNGQFEAGGETDLQGRYSIPVVPDQWNVAAANNSSALAGYVVAGGTNTAIAAGQAIRVDFTVVRATGTIAGSVKDTSDGPIGGLSVWSYAFINGVGYNAGARTDGNGNYSLAVIDGTWAVGLSCDGNDGLPRLGFDCVPERTVSVPPANATASFIVYPYGTPLFGNPYRPGNGQFLFQFIGARGTNYTVQASVNLGSWSTIVVTNLPEYMIFLQDNQATNSHRFYRAYTGP